MIRRIDLRDGSAGAAAPDYRTLVPRADFDVEAALHVVRPICDDVRDRGVEAIAEYSAKFDGVEQTDIAVPREALRAPWPRWTRQSGPAWRSRSAGCGSPARPSSSRTSSPTSVPAPASPSG